MTKGYKPEPDKPGAIELNPSLVDLSEAIAKNVHDSYVAARLEQGWDVGPARNDAKKTNPTFVPYEDLEDSEKELDRRTADTTLKTILSLGYQIIDPKQERNRNEEALEEVARRLGEEACSLRMLREVWAGREEWGFDLPTVQKLVGLALDLGELSLVYEIGRQGIEADPCNAYLAQQVALAHVHDGHHERAKEILAPILEAQRLSALQPGERGEMLAAMGRIHKEIFRRSHVHADLELAIEAYQRAFKEGDGSSFPLINEASLRLVAGQQDEARELAQEVLTLVGQPDDAWSYATQAEAFLLTGELEAACEAYRAALAEKPSWRAAARMREQALWIWEEKCATDDPGFERTSLASGSKLREAFAGLPSVVVYGGHMVGDERFPQEEADAAGERLAAALARLDPAILYGSARCGADLLILEAAGDDVERQVVLPGPEKEFVDASVCPGGAGWKDRFLAQMNRAAGDPVQINRHDPGGNRVARAYTQEVVIGMAKLRARRLGLDTKALVLWDRTPGSDTGGIRNFVARCSEAGIPVEVVSPWDDPVVGRAQEEELDPGGYNITGPRAGSGEQVVKAMLFADVKGFSKLGEVQIVPFQNKYMRMVSALIDKGQAGPIVTNTWGDAIYMAFDTVLDAARFALQMREKLNATDLETLGLPKDLAIRTALHAGPVFPLVDPVTRFFTYTGSHVTYTARLEPVTEPGQIYVSEQFAALLELAPGRDEIALYYVGHRPAAKGYGEVSLYRLSRA